MNEEPEVRAGRELVMLDSMLAEGATIAGDVVEIDAHTWAIHGVIPVDGDVILAEFGAREQALGLLAQLSEPRRGEL